MSEIIAKADENILAATEPIVSAPAAESSEPIDELVGGVQDLAVESQQMNIREHLVSDVHFSDPSLGISKNMQRALIEESQKEYASVIQSLVIPVANAGHNIKAQAQSGSGKTLAFCISMLNKVDPALKEAQVICVAPYRELCEQIYEEAVKLCKFTPEIQIQLLVSGSDPSLTEPLCKKQVIISTPQTVSNFAGKRGPGGRQPPYFNIDKIKMFVVDEADDQVTSKNSSKAKQSFEEANKLIQFTDKLPVSCQVLLFSATYPPESKALCDAVLHVSKRKEHMKIELKKEELNLKEIFQVSLDVQSLTDTTMRGFRSSDNMMENRKLFMLKQILEKISVQKCIIFVTRRVDAHTIKRLCSEMVPPIIVEVLVGGNEGDKGAMTKEDRTRVSNKFRTDGNCRYLVSTNLLARGYDVPEVSTVVNYDLPIHFDERSRSALPRGDSETYIHKVGRTGRFGKKGVAINLLHGEQDARLMESIAREAYVSDSTTANSSEFIIRAWDPNAFDDLVEEVEKFTGRK